ncbi:unnamed protein product [Acanthoscelides obtectus]|uniref:CCAAT-binding factor domain-containing protein n=1 Tax=Acanthoscelides obtectus TaxID=200917 RepID=A0A9P0KM26_ACAOB|nr:unnamed protein product [Acanthoscelides obtectus]CAK1642706.1 Nucleolar complex protein 4 homolog B [Acanthoscelides obtectus]
MSHQERPLKISKQLRQRANEFLSCKKNRRCLEDILHHFGSGADQHSCLLALESVFTSLIKEKDMYIEVVALKPLERTPENLHKRWLRQLYDDTYNKILHCFENPSPKIQAQALTTAMNIIAAEGKHPLDNTILNKYVPLTKLKAVLNKMLSSSQNNTHLINKFTEYLLYNDILFYTWTLLPSLTPKYNPCEVYISNFLTLLGKLDIYQNGEMKLLCGDDNNPFVTFDENKTKKYLNKVWHCVMHWEHTHQNQQAMLLVLLEKVMSHLEKPLLLTDFLMDSLDVPGPISLLALQGILILIQGHNLDYPGIFEKLYSMFEPEIFHTKYKSRLFFLADTFLSSTHLPENLVAAFAKRLARLALIAPSEDVIIICNFIGNLILRHPGLKCLLNNPDTATYTSDPYIMEERDPVKSNAINSSLWEIRTLQQHVQPSVAIAAQFINSPLPSVEWDVSRLISKTGDDIFDRELKKFSKLILLHFEKPQDAEKHERVIQYWHL